MSKRIAAIGDIHACCTELKELLSRLEWLSLDEIWHLGDICDRGEDNAATVGILREKHIPGVAGNHEESILKHWDRIQAGGSLPNNEDKRRTLLQLCNEDIEYIKKLPKMHVIDELNLVLVHGGLWPTIPLYQQPHDIIRAQMILPNDPTKTRWWGAQASSHKSGKTEEQNFQEGFFRWYEIYDHTQNCVYGHSTFTQPFIHQKEGFGKTIGVDTGSCFGGMLTAAVFDGGDPWFVSIKAKRVWFERGFRVHQE